jgi:hypothetical protein
LLGTAAEIIAAALCDDDRTAAAVGMLLAEAGPTADGEVDAARERLSRLLCDSGMLQQALAWAVAFNARRIAAIRRFFLDPSETYSVGELAEVWQIPAQTVEAIYEDEIAAWEARPEGKRGSFAVRWADAVGTAVALALYRPMEIEMALGADFARARPGDWCVRPLVIGLPRRLLDTIASESILPPTLSIEARIEQLLLLIMQRRGGRPLV